MPKLLPFLTAFALSSGVCASPDELSDTAKSADTGTFSVREKEKIPKQKMEEQIMMEKDEYDAFGENKFNWNSDPSLYDEKPTPKRKGAK